VAQEERAQLKKAFDVFDQSRTGVIDPGDIHKMLESMKVNTRSDLVADLWAVLDQDKTNKITFEEFAPVYVNWHRYGLRQERKMLLDPQELDKVKGLFRTLDVSQTGWLSADEMNAAFDRLLGTELGPEDRNMIMRMFKAPAAERTMGPPSQPTACTRMTERLRLTERPAFRSYRRSTRAPPRKR
jgi:Ca2+-binding EF-hand superfamily protein